MTPRFYHGFFIAIYTALTLAWPLGVVSGDSPFVGDAAIFLGLLSLTGAVLLFLEIRVFRRIPSGATYEDWPAIEAVRAAAKANSRFWPGHLLAIGIVAVGLCWFDMRSKRDAWLPLYLLAAMTFTIGLVGTIHPPYYYALRRDVPAPKRTRARPTSLPCSGLRSALVGPRGFADGEDGASR